MKLPENDYQILRLTDLFYQQYPNPPRKEMLKSKIEHITVCFFKHITTTLYVFRIEVKFRIRLHIFLNNRFVQRNTNQVWIIRKYS